MEAGGTKGGITPVVKVYHLECEGQAHEVGVENIDGKVTVTVNGKRRFVDLARLNGDGALSILLDGRSFDLEVKESEKGVSVFALGRHFDITVEEEKVHRARLLSGIAKRAAQEKEVRAPMPGLIVKIEVAAGQAVEPGQGLLIMEAMKMENEIKARGACRVKEIRVSPRQPVEQNQVLILFE